MLQVRYLLIQNLIIREVSDEYSEEDKQEI